MLLLIMMVGFVRFSTDPGLFVQERLVRASPFMEEMTWPESSASASMDPPRT